MLNDILLIAGFGIFISFVFSVLVYIDLVKYTFPKVTTFTIKNRILAFAGYFLLKFLVYFLAVNFSRVLIYHPPLRLIFLTQLIVVLTIKCLLAFVLKSVKKYEMIVIEIPTLLVTAIPVWWYCWGWEWIGD